MTQTEFKIDGYDFVFRIARMNAIEVLALRTQLNFKSVETATKLFETYLEHIEVKLGDQWLKVKDGNDYYPSGIEEDYDAIKKLVDYFSNNFLIPVFQKSNESK